MKFSPNRKGNALLIALLLTTLLSLLTVNLSKLVTSETRQISLLINNGAAQYLAEGGSEVALFSIHHNEPGFEPSINNEPIILSTNDNENLSEQFSYSIDASASSLPIVEDYISELVDDGRLEKKELFTELALNESVTIPLQEGAKQFEFQYYLPVAANVNLPDWDILLWKLFGQNPEKNYNTDSMSEFLPAAGAISGASRDFVPGSSNVGSIAENPAKFGTVPNAFNCGLFFEYSSGDPVSAGTVEEKRECKLISEFLDTHNKNYLIVKNAINPAQIDISQLGPTITIAEASTLKYRVCTPNCNSPAANNKGLVPEFATIESSGKTRKTEKQLLTRVNREGFLPVFDFAIYRTAN